MPSRYTAKLNIDAAHEDSEILGTHLREVNTEPMYRAFLDTLHSAFPDRPADVTEENLKHACAAPC